MHLVAEITSPYILHRGKYCYSIHYSIQEDLASAANKGGGGSIAAVVGEINELLTIYTHVCSALPQSEAGSRGRREAASLDTGTHTLRPLHICTIHSTRSPTLHRRSGECPALSGPGHRVQKGLGIMCYMCKLPQVSDLVCRSFHFKYMCVIMSVLYNFKW